MTYVQESARAAEPPALDEATSIPSTTTKILHIILIAFIAIAFTALFISGYEWLNNIIWFNNDFMTTDRWMIPVGVLTFSLAVGLCQKYLHAPTVIDGGFVESIKEGGKKADYRTFPGALLSSLFSLLSGASVGPEGTIAILVGDISSFIREKFKIANESADDAIGFDVAALASAFNGIIGSVLFTGVFATEFQVGGKKDAFRFLIWNLLAGAIGFLFYASLGLPSFAQAIPFSPITELKIAYVAYAVILGVLGAMLAFFSRLSMQKIGTIMEKRFHNRVILRTFAAGVVIAIIGYFIPDLLFSGEKQIHSIIQNPSEIGIAMLLIMAVLKILLLALSFKSGYLGGPIFPILFSSTMIALALNLAFPSVPLSIFVLCIETAAMTLALGAPLTAILLVAVTGTANPYTIALLALSAVTAMILALIFMKRKEQQSTGIDKLQPS
ncbi:MAG: chloride channel protein [Methanotrichaceae archaeon]|nr:chloride channel protein [Methanotrichaceae archaeon]